MKAPPFAYARPSDVAQAIAFLARYGEGARLLAGGQSLMPTLNMRLSAPEVLIDINRIPELAGIALVDGVLRIGATTRHVTVERSPLVARHAPLLAQAMPHVAHAAIRNRGTFGGSLAFGDPAAELPACMVALGGRIVLESAAGRRAVPADEFYEGLYRNAMRPGEILVAGEIPIATDDARCGFAELARRRGDYAMIGLAACAPLRGGSFAAPRLVFFAAGDKPVMARHAGAALAGRPNTAEAREAAAQALEQDLDPPNDLNASAEMRLHLAKVLTRRVLEAIAP